MSQRIQNTTTPPYPESTDNTTMILQKEIDNKRKEINSDSYSMSIGEIINLYRDKEIHIQPEYQRLFRWTDSQKSRLVDSILLGIPIPSIFVAQREDGVWELVDGLQRLSTILQLVGVLRDSDGRRLPPLKLSGTKYLPSLEGCVWDKTGDDSPALSDTQKLLIKRAKLDVKIVLKESDVTSKYELFQRLNTGGSRLSDQEVRNCMLVMVNPRFHKKLKEFACNENFKICCQITHKQKEEQYDLELVTRFLVLRKVSKLKELSRIGDLGDFITDAIVSKAEDARYNLDLEREAFDITFEILRKALGESAFKRFNRSKRRFEGKFLISLFEVLAVGLGYHQPNLGPVSKLKVMAVAKGLWQKEEFKKNSGAGVRASTRVGVTINIGRRSFSP